MVLQLHKTHSQKDHSQKEKKRAIKLLAALKVGEEESDGHRGINWHRA